MYIGAFAVLAGATADASQYPVDSRAGTTTVLRSPTGIIYRDSDPAPTGIRVATLMGAANVTTEYAFPAILKPGDGFMVQHQTVNVTLWASFLWRERRANAAEIVFRGG